MKNLFKRGATELTLQAAALALLTSTALASDEGRRIRPQQLSEPPDSQPQPPDQLPVQLGTDVSVDGRTAVVAVDEGRAAYVYELRDKRWVYRAALVPEVGVTSRAADVRGNVAIVGGDIDGETVAFVFVRNEGVWTQTQTLRGFDPEINGSRPYVALGDGFAVVGDPRAFDYQGGVHVFNEVGLGTYVHDVSLTGANTGQGALVGYGVEISGETILAGSPGWQRGFVFTRTGGVWSEQQQLEPSIGWAETSMDISGDTIVMGTGQATVIFERTGDTWTETQVLAGTPTEPFNGPVAIGGDRVITGDTNERGHFFYEFRRSADGQWSSGRVFRSPHPVNFFGQPIALAGDVLIAGYPDIATPHPLFEGTVYAYDLSR